MLLALGLTLGGYCVLLAWRRPALAAQASPAPVAIAPIPDPAQLPTSADFGRVPLADSERRAAARIPITVRVRNVPEAWRTPSAGIAIGLQDGSSGLAWLPLASAANEGGAFVFTHQLPHAGDAVVALAAAPAFATHSYVARAVLAVPAATTIELDGEAAMVTFRLPTGVEHASPLRVRRLDDEAWMPMHGATAGLEPAADAPAVLWLGAGAYELSDPLRPELRQGFEVPKQTAIEVTAGSPRVRAGRP